LNVGALSALALSCSLAGCADVAPSQDPGTGTVRIVKADEAAGALVLSFEQEGRAITYDMRLGPVMETPPSAEELAANPDLPSYQVDARVLDSNGQPFHMQMGGDAFIEASWTTPKVEGFDEAERDKDFQMTRDAVPALRALKVPAGLNQLRLSAMEIGNTLDEAADKSDSDPGEAPSTEARAALAVAPCVVCAGPRSVAKWDFQVRRHPVALVGDHSAVLLRGWSSATKIVYTAVSCNHGACANSSSMTTKCTMAGFKVDDGTHSRFFYSDGCSTPYNVLSIRGHHNCNDDSELQGRAIWQDRGQSTTGGNCSSLAPHVKAPGCSF
jgi:hypothetical protein